MASHLYTEGAKVYYKSISTGQWVATVVTRIRGADVEVACKPNYFISLEEQKERLALPGSTGGGYKAELPQPAVPHGTKKSYCVGDKVQVWSQGKQQWSHAIVIKIQSGLITVQYDRDGQMVQKDLPEEHEHLKPFAGIHAFGHTSASVVPSAAVGARGTATRGFMGALQKGFGPEMWGITLEQLSAVPHSVPDSGIRPGLDWLKGDDLLFPSDRAPVIPPPLKGVNTMRDVVEKVVKNETKGKGVGYALLKNAASPLRARVMVSHSWDEVYHEFVAAIQLFEKEKDAVAYWVCAMAIYQNEDGAGPTIKEQLGPDPHYGPFATVLKQADLMIAIVDSAGNLYERMWCIFEMFVALELKLKVEVAQYSIVQHIGFSHFSGDMAGDELIAPLLKQCETPINCNLARCGNPRNPMNDDEKEIRKAIESGVGYAYVDRKIETARFEAVLKLEYGLSSDLSPKQMEEQSAIFFMRKSVALKGMLKKISASDLTPQALCLLKGIGKQITIEGRSLLDEVEKMRQTPTNLRV